MSDKPLDLSAFEGFTPGPLPTTPSEMHPTEQVLVAECYISLVDKCLYDAAPALLAECKHQRNLLDAFACGVQDMLDAWDHPTSASVGMRCSAIAGLRGIMEHWQAGATDPEVTRLNDKLTRQQAALHQSRERERVLVAALDSVVHNLRDYVDTGDNGFVDNADRAARAALSERGAAGQGVRDE